VLTIVAAVWIIGTCLVWLTGPFLSLMMLRYIPRLEDQELAPLNDPPRVSIVIPACNEADTIEPALRSLRAQSYPHLEIILIDDRSTDGTGIIVDRMATEDPRIIPLHIESLPEGWLGKVHALQRGVEKATGEWLLFTDADVRYSPDALEKAIRWSVQTGIDHLFLFPRVFSHGIAVELMIGAAIRTIALTQRPWRAMDPKYEESIGGGAFNLVRRSAFERTPGFEWLKMEVADDLGLAHMMKKHGGRPSALLALSLLEVEWYRSVGDCFRGMEKNAFAQMARFSLWRGVVIAIAALVLSLGPPAAFFVPIPWIWIAGALAFGTNFVGAFAIRKHSSIRWPVAAFSAPLGDLLMAVLLFRASILGWWRGGLVWRGTRYPNGALRAGARIKF
jgi:glycosyltransferase involved in cell wall biosynthesis